MKIYIPHPYPAKEQVYTSGSGASLSGFNHTRALAKLCEVYLPAREPQHYEHNIYGVSPAFETIASSLKWAWFK